MTKLDSKLEVTWCHQWNRSTLKDLLNEYLKENGDKIKIENKTDLDIVLNLKQLIMQRIGDGINESNRQFYVFFMKLLL